MSSDWTAEELEIFALYKGKCILYAVSANCQKRAVTLHEIIPKSKRPKTWNTPDNRVPVCAECHRMIHDKGAKNYVSLLTDLQYDACRTEKRST